jgi:type I restriction enzyme S subunit
MHLLQHFKELTVRPKNAKELKGLILQLALQGILTANWRIENPNIETAKQIYQRINKERNKLIIERKIKLKNIKPIQETLNMRYKLPDTWSWFNFSDVIFYQEGPGIRTWQFRDTGVKLLNVQNIVGDTLVLDNTEKHVDKAEFDEKYQHFKVEEGDLLFASSGGSWGKSSWFKDPGYEVMMNTSMIRLRFYSKEWYPEYLKYFLSSIFFKKQLECQLVGIQPNFGSTHLGRSFIPIPPIEEQKAIVAVVETLFKEVEQLEQLTIARISLKEKFVISALNQLKTNNTKKDWAFLQEHFYSFFNEKSNIKKLRETVLQLAVQGKLTADWRDNNPDTEDASVLLKRIQKEKAQLIKDKKIKKETALHAINKDEIPYELPEGWAWCRLGEMLLYSDSGKSPDCEKRSVTNKEWGVLTTTALQKNKFVESANKVLPLNYEINPKQIVEVGDILITRAGPINRTGIACKVDKLQFNLVLSDKTIRLKYIQESISPDYLVLTLNSESTRKLLLGKMIGMASSQVNISQANIKGICFPLPPLEEQKAIVEKVNALMCLCNALEKEVKQSQEQSEKLMRSVLREVFETGKSL